MGLHSVADVGFGCLALVGSFLWPAGSDYRVHSVVCTVAFTLRYAKQVG